MKKLLLLLPLLVATCFGYAQVRTTFTVDINDDINDSNIISVSAYSMRQTTDGGYIEAGNIEQSYGLQNICLLKLDAYGKKQWLKIIYTTGVDNAWTIRQTPDGGYAVAGSTNRSGNYNMLLDKFDSSGNLIWSKTYNVPGITDTTDAQWLELTKDGGYIMTGYYQITLNGNAYNLGYIVKTDSKGDTAWTQKFGDDKHETFGNCISPAKDGGYIVGGYEVIDTIYYIYLLKLNSVGGKVWEKTYGDGSGTYDYLLWSVVQTRDGNYIATGSTDSVEDGNSGITHFWILKTDSTGDSTWEHAYAHDSSGGTGITEAADGDYVACGSINIGMNNYYGYIVKVTPAGVIDWQQNLTAAASGSGVSIQQTTDGGYDLSAVQTITGLGYHNGALAIKTDSNGNVSVTIDTLNIVNGDTTIANGIGGSVTWSNGDSSNLTGISVNNINPGQIITLYPNPFSTQTTIYVKGTSLQNALLSIYDVSGKEVNRIEKISSNLIIIDRNNLNNGTYFYRLVNNGQVVNIGKIIVE